MARGENIFLRKDGRFEARYAKGKDEKGRLIYGFCYGRTYEEAKEKVTCAKEGVIGNVYGTHQQERIFSDYCDSWLAVNSARLKASSRAKYHADIENHIKPYFGNELPYRITSEKTDHFTQILLYEKRLSEKTVRDILALFHSIFIYTIRRTSRKITDIEIIYPKKIRKTVRVLSRQEEETLSMYLFSRMDLCKLGVYLALRTGLRVGEVCALRWGDISMSEKTISVRHTVQRIQNLSAQTHCRTEIVVGTPKSDSSCRTIPLMPDLAVLFARFCCADPETFVLTGTGRCMEPRKLQRRLKIYMEECRIPEAHFHTLRHTFATRCIEVGFDVKTLSEILGHSNINITLNQYVHPDMERKRENMSRLKNLICL